MMGSLPGGFRAWEGNSSGVAGTRRDADGMGWVVLDRMNGMDRMGGGKGF
jgi:hypothetical protein